MPKMSRYVKTFRVKALVLLMAKMTRYIKTFKVKYEDKHKNNTLMFFCIDNEKLLEK